MSVQKDIFLCHAREDKHDIVKPLVIACEEAGISYWYDEAEIKWGDSIPQKVNENCDDIVSYVKNGSTPFLWRKIVPNFYVLI